MSRVITCTCGCDRTGELGVRTWIRPCAMRWRNAGRPETGPPPPSRTYPAGRPADRRDAYAAHRDAGDTPEQAARRLGVSRATRTRYEARYQQTLRDQGGSDVPERP
ncbi:hypothetical protein ACFOWE_31365 [Planomonospora corallina]|uniref:Homeodomain-like domain-containing protein n=1 Tax=Planomonospora corallina TaxID=1806052 RepID=A0ABV8IIL8_9ACTN